MIPLPGHKSSSWLQARPRCRSAKNLSAAEKFIAPNKQHHGSGASWLGLHGNLLAHIVCRWNSVPQIRRMKGLLLTTMHNAACTAKQTHSSEAWLQRGGSLLLPSFDPQYCSDMHRMTHDFLVTMVPHVVTIVTTSSCQTASLITHVVWQDLSSGITWL